MPRVECLREHDVRPGPFWSLGFRVLVCRSCGRQWQLDGDGRWHEIERDDDGEEELKKSDDTD